MLVSFVLYDTELKADKEEEAQERKSRDRLSSDEDEGFTEVSKHGWFNVMTIPCITTSSYLPTPPTLPSHSAKELFLVLMFVMSLQY